MSVRVESFRDSEHERNTSRIVYDEQNNHVYIETFGNHDGVSVHTKVRVDRMVFVEKVRKLGCL